MKSIKSVDWFSLLGKALGLICLFIAIDILMNWNDSIKAFNKGFNETYNKTTR
jgi:hypothetical protein